MGAETGETGKASAVRPSSDGVVASRLGLAGALERRALGQRIMEKSGKRKRLL